MGVSIGEDNVGCKVVIIILVIVGIVVGIFYGVRNCVRSNVLEPFEPYLAEYTGIHTTPYSSGNPYIKGKVITVDIGENELDSFYFDLPEDMVAPNPEEVGTIIWLSWSKVYVGRYTDGANGYRWDCDITIIDKAVAKVVGYHHFTGSDPPDTKNSSGNREGSKPSDKVVDYLKSLPRL